MDQVAPCREFYVRPVDGGVLTGEAAAMMSLIRPMAVGRSTVERDFTATAHRGSVEIVWIVVNAHGSSGGSAGAEGQRSGERTLRPGGLKSPCGSASWKLTPLPLANLPFSYR